MKDIQDQKSSNPAGNEEWIKSAEDCMNELLDAHEALDRDRLWRALQGMRILVGRTPRMQ